MSQSYIISMLSHDGCMWHHHATGIPSPFASRPSIVQHLPSLPFSFTVSTICCLAPAWQIEARWGGSFSAPRRPGLCSQHPYQSSAAVRIRACTFLCMYIPVSLAGCISKASPMVLDTFRCRGTRAKFVLLDGMRDVAVRPTTHLPLG